jgi:hypothetical protein
MLLVIAAFLKRLLMMLTILARRFMLAFLGADAPALEYFSERLVLAHL